MEWDLERNGISAPDGLSVLVCIVAGFVTLVTKLQDPFKHALNPRNRYRDRKFPDT